MHTPTLPTGQPAIGPALHRAWGSMKARLFQPFQIGLWLALGLSAWLSEIHQSLSSLINAPLQFLDLEQHFSDIHTWIASLPILWVGTGIFLAIVLIVVGYYIAARGKFMLIHQLARNTTDVGVPWKDNGSESLSYFLWTLMIGSGVTLLFGMVIAILVGITVASTHGSASVAGLTAVTITVAVLMALLFLLFYLVWLVVTDLIRPVMWMHQCSFPEGWQTLWPCLKAEPGTVFLYALTRVGIQIGFSMAIMVGGLLTCCCGFLLIAIPYIGQVITLPVYAFNQLYALEFLKGFGPDYDAFRARIPASSIPSMEAPNEDLPAGFA
ncbi:MAG: hypothetical protein H7A43_02320 [Verrucomicrobia bacterium]|nr:hypothetical protein [Verrucomicrobiota bacterium]